MKATIRGYKKDKTDGDCETHARFVRQSTGLVAILDAVKDALLEKSDRITMLITYDNGMQKSA